MSFSFRAPALLLLTTFSQAKSHPERVDGNQSTTGIVYDDGLDIFRYVVHGIYITLILILILIIIFCPRCSLISDNLPCCPNIRAHYKPLPNSDNDTSTTATAEHSTAKFALLHKTHHQKRQIPDNQLGKVSALGEVVNQSETISPSSIISRDG